MKIQEIRQNKNMTQQELAERSGVSVRTIQAYESGIRRIDGASILTLCNLSKVMGCKITEILEDPELIDVFNRVK